MKKSSLLGFALAFACLLAVASPASAATTCNGTLSGSHSSIVVPTNGSCTLNGATVTGGVTVKGGAYFEAKATSIGSTVTATSAAITVFIHSGSSVGGTVSLYQTAQLYLYNSTVGNNVTVLQSIKDWGAVQICGTTIGGTLKVNQMGKDVLIGNSDPTAGCAGNTVKGNAIVNANNTFIEMLVSGNKVNGNLTVNRNKGTSGKSVDHNTGGAALACSGNKPPFIGSPNPGFATYSGQCS